MLEMILEGRILYVLMGILTAAGVLSKIVVNISLKRLVWAAGNMHKSNHPLMRLVKAKFEHACMVSDTVDNVEVFVDKYLYEYRVIGVKLHSWRRMEKAAAAGCLILGIAGGAGWYILLGVMRDEVLQTGAIGAGLAVFVYLFHQTTDEGYRLNAVKNYMVDYLENVCRRKYEKAYQKEIQVMAPEAHVVAEEPVRAPAVAQRAEEKEAEAEPEVRESVPAEIQPKKSEEQKAEVQENVRTAETEKEKEVDKDVLIRQILEEFMA